MRRLAYRNRATTVRRQRASRFQYSRARVHLDNAVECIAYRVRCSNSAVLGTYASRVFSRSCGCTTCTSGLEMQRQTAEMNQTVSIAPLCISRVAESLHLNSSGPSNTVSVLHCQWGSSNLQDTNLYLDYSRTLIRSTYLRCIHSAVVVS